jgi:thioredoxin-dependent peroxiredoxin
MFERVGEAFELDEQLTVLGTQLKPGDLAPEFELDTMDPESGAIRQVRLSDSAGWVRLLHIVNSLDTPVCHIGARRWDALQSGLPDGVQVYTISMDLPFALSRWQQAEDASHQLLSAHRGEHFGVDYGVLLREWRLLQRAVLVIDREGRVAYSEYVADQMHEPDYDAAVAAVREAMSKG